MAYDYDPDDHGDHHSDPAPDAFSDDGYADAGSGSNSYGTDAGSGAGVGFDFGHGDAPDAHPVTVDDPYRLDGPAPADAPGPQEDPYRLDDGPVNGSHPALGLPPEADPYALEPTPGAEAVPDPYGAEGADGARAHDAVIGDPEAAARFWHQQEQPFSCAVVSQEYVLDQVTGTDRTETDLAALAEEQGWYHPEQGTSMGDMSRLLEHHGVPVSVRRGANMDDLRFALADGDHVLVPLDSDEILGPPDTHPVDLEGVYVIPGQGADHVVVVTGLDYTDPDGPVVILNDPGHPDGAAFRVPMTAFYRAWTDSGHHLVRAEGPPGTGTDE